MKTLEYAPAFPVTELDENDNVKDGLSKLEYFASKIVSARIAYGGYPLDDQECTDRAVQLAKQLVVSLNRNL